MRVRTKQRTIAIAILVIVIGAFAYVILSRYREPRYKDKPLSEWLAIYTTEPMGGSSAPAETQRAEAELAIRSIGTKALPFVLEWMRYEPPPWLEQIASSPGVKKAFGYFVQKALTGGKATKRASDAVAVFFILRSNAVSAIPELETLMKDNQRPFRASCAITSLSWIGSPAIPALTNALADPNQFNRSEILFALGRLARPGSAADACLPAMLRALNDRDRDVRRMATNFLKHRAPETLTNAPPK